MVLGAAPVHRFAGVGAQGVDQSGGGHRLQRAVDGGQADALAAAAQFVVQFLGGPEFVDVLEQRRDGGALPGGADGGACRLIARACSLGVLVGVGDGGQHDVGEVVVDEAVVHLAARAFARRRRPRPSGCAGAG